LRRRVSDLERQIGAQSREAESRLKQDLQDKELAFQAKLKQRDQELALKADARETELRKQLASDLRAREEDWERQTQARIRTTEARLTREAQEKEEMFVAKSRQREEQWQVKLDGVLAELQSQTASIEPFKEQLARTEKERDEARQIANESTRHVETMEKKLNEASSFLTGWRNGKRPVGT
jgi:chromosome segregation ATPase